MSTISLPPSLSPRIPIKRSLTPVKSVVLELESDILPESDSNASTGEATATPLVDNDEPDKAPEPPKKKRRVALTRMGDVGS